MNDVTPRSLGEAYAVWVEAVENTFRELVQASAALVPNLIGAVVLLFVGWALAALLRTLILRLGTGLDRLAEGMGIRVGAETTEIRWPVSRIVAVTVYWLVILFFIVVAAELLGLAAVAGLFGDLMGYVPTVLLSVAALYVVVALSAGVARWVEHAARSAGIASALALGACLRILIVAMAAILTLAQIGIDTALLVNVFTLVVAAFLLGAALAFGIGAADAVRNIISAHHTRGSYQVGQRVRVSGEEGEILELTPTGVVLETEAGRTLVPARLFLEQVSILLDAGRDRG